MGLRAYKYYTSTPSFVINKKINKRQTRDEKNIVRKFKIRKKVLVQKQKFVHKHKHVQMH